MIEPREVAIVGAGPAGLACATVLAGAGVDVVVLDEQATPGGQVFRALDAASPRLRAVLGTETMRGLDLIAAFRDSGADYRPGSAVWQITPEREVWFSRGGRSGAIGAKFVVLATGAMERAVPFPGWTLPGVMTAGAVQIALKTGGIVPHGAVLAGSGPLLYLLASQMIAARAPPRAVVDTAPTPSSQALRLLPAAVREGALPDLAVGVMLRASLRAHGITWHKRATDLSLEGAGRIEAIAFTARGQRHRVSTPLVALHEGVVPVPHAASSIGCDFAWDQGQRAFRPVVDSWGASSVDGVLIAGDAAGIAGWRAAVHAGRLAAWEALHRLGRIDRTERDLRAAPDQRASSRRRAVRPLLEALFPPSDAALLPPDDVIVCRCEEVTAGAVRAAAARGCLGPNQAKTYLRVGMGPCQGRMCGLTVAELIAATRGVPVADVGQLRARPPLKPITVGDLAAAL